MGDLTTVAILSVLAGTTVMFAGSLSSKISNRKRQLKRRNEMREAARRNGIAVDADGKPRHEQMTSALQSASSNASASFGNLRVEQGAASKAIGVQG